MTVFLIDATLQTGLASVRVVEPPRDERIEPVDNPSTGIGYQLDLLDVAGLESRGRAARQVEAHAVRLHSIEDQSLVHLEEVIVSTDLDRPVAGVVDADRHDGAARVEL